MWENLNRKKKYFKII